MSERRYEVKRGCRVVASGPDGTVTEECLWPAIDPLQHDLDDIHARLTALEAIRTKPHETCANGQGTSKSRSGEPEFPETPDFPAQENGAVQESTKDESAGKLHAGGDNSRGCELVEEK